VTRPVVLIALPLADDLMKVIEGECEIMLCANGAAVPDAGDLAARLPQVDGVLTTMRSRYDETLLNQGPRLKVVSNFAVGFDNVDVPAATRAGVLVCNTPGVLDRAVAELAIGLIIMTGRNMLANDRFVRDGEWAKGAAPLAIDVGDKVLGLLGMGRIGTVVAKAAHALGMKVIYHKRSRDTEIEAAGIADYCSREELFARSDFVSVHTPLDAGTRGSIGTREFNVMKPTAYFINTSRGGVVDEPALIDALKNGTIAGAGLDVMATEPIGADHPLCGLPNVVLQPHIGSATVETRRAMIELAVHNLVAAVNGRKPEAMVNPEVWSSPSGSGPA
jgi:glyoxylate reductase